ncbi:MAG: leucine--tRNA ligase [Bacteroidota bacterium]
MSDYNFSLVEKKWQQFWDENQTFETKTEPNKPKYYVLDMFPYPSGAGLHVGHPLGYIASDIIARYKRLKGFNVLHPMGFDSFGLPAEQYAIQTGQHPAITTEQNIATFTRQLKSLGFSYDWNKVVKTSDPAYYKWTQWIFMQLFNHFYNLKSDKAEPISTLITTFEKEGNATIKAACDEDTPNFSADDWAKMSEKEQQLMLFKYRLTFPDESTVNWCPGLGSVLSNDEVKEGVSERGGFPVEQKLMKQWAMRITAYSERLINGLNEVDWSDSIKDQQRNWIGTSQGASVRFEILDVRNKSLNLPNIQHPASNIEVFTTRIDTIFGVSYMVLAPEHELVGVLTTSEQKSAVEEYVTWTKSRSEVERQSEVKKVSGVFTGSYCINPFNQEKVPIYLADYVLAGYGTGAVMGVPSGDQRDWNFATHFGLPIIPILDSQKGIEKEADNTKEGKYINSGIINGLDYKAANEVLIKFLEENKIGKGKIQYRLRNAVFSRQRYWGEPVPVYYKEEIPYLIEESELPLVLPEVDKYLPTETGEPPLGNAKDWKYLGKYEYELSTMPGWAGSSWYWYRYMDNKNESQLADNQAIDYWKDIDLYMGGSEHATGHLLYSRFWNHFLFDIGIAPKREFARKLINQGMIQGRSNFVYRIKMEAGGQQTFVSFGLKDQHETTPLHVDVNIVENDVLDIEKFKASRNDIGENPQFILENGKYICGTEVEKMSKSKYNVVNPDDIIEKYGTDTLRLYEMFLGPLEQAKPWNTNSISGSFNFLKKVWRLFYDDQDKLKIVSQEPTNQELKVLHTAIKKVTDEIERYSFNTVVSTLMICANELAALKCNKKAILEQFLILLSPYAPHISEELWEALGHESGSISYAQFPEFDPKLLEEDNFEYPISINGKVRANLALPVTFSNTDIEKAVLENTIVQKWLEGKAPKKVIVVPKRIVNVVI